MVQPWAGAGPFGGSQAAFPTPAWLTISPTSLPRACRTQTKPAVASPTGIPDSSPPRRPPPPRRLSPKPSPAMSSTRTATASATRTATVSPRLTATASPTPTTTASPTSSGTTPGKLGLAPSWLPSAQLTGSCTFWLARGWYAPEQVIAGSWQWSSGEGYIRVTAARAMQVVLNVGLVAAMPQDSVNVVLNGKRVAKVSITSAAGPTPISPLTLQLRAGGQSPDST